MSDSKNTGEQEWPKETYVPLHSIRDRLLSDEALTLVARGQWMRTRVRDATKKGRPTILQPWESLPSDVTDQLLHEARQDLEAALQAAFPKEESE
jgi:hypothetical protein